MKGTMGKSRTAKYILDIYTHEAVLLHITLWCISSTTTLYTAHIEAVLSIPLTPKQLCVFRSEMCQDLISSTNVASKSWADWADWDRIGYNDWPNRRQPDLKDTNHPMFHRSGFTGDDEDFSLISPAVRLASQLLYAPKSMLFIYSLVYECRTLPKEFDHMGRSCSEFRRTAETNEELIQARVDRIFNEMGSHFTFVSKKLLNLPRHHSISDAEKSQELRGLKVEVDLDADSEFHRGQAPMMTSGAIEWSVKTLPLCVLQTSL